MFNILTYIECTTFLTTDLEFPRSHDGTILSAAFPWQAASYAYTDMRLHLYGVSLVNPPHLLYNHIISKYRRRLQILPLNQSIFRKETSPILSFYDLCKQKYNKYV